MRSMTGYGRAEAAYGHGHVVVEIRTVNHRFLDVRTRFAVELAEYAATAEALARASLQRGRIEISAKPSGHVTQGSRLDRERARMVYGELTELAQELGLTEPVPISLLGTIPDLFVRGSSEGQDGLRESVESATRQAIAKLTEMRESEGAALARDLGTRVATLRSLTASIRPHSARVVDDYRTRLHKRISGLLDGSGVKLDEARLEHEVAAFADRADVSEELTRLDSHCDQFQTLLQTPGGVGRKLDFLLQEMGREVNTVGSKIADVEVTRQVLDMKAELERMREQAQNVL